MRSRLALALSLLLASGCASAGGEESAAAMDRAQGGAPAERLLVKTAALTVAVADVAAAADAAAALAEGMDGYAVGTSVRGDEHARLDMRVPAARLDEALGALAALGEERSRHVSASDVTAEVGDLEATLANQRALRDRLRALLARAEKVEEVLEVERELTRLQTDIDRGEARLKRLRTDVALSAISLELVRRPKPRILGPLGYLYVGTKWLVTKLFVIRE